ncbi:transposase [Rhizobium leguminosarum]|nr:transposase [Rhizobium leguminosarum]
MGTDGASLSGQDHRSRPQGGHNRLFLEAVLWKACTSPWRDLPKEFGNWNTVFKRVDD